MRTMPTTNTTDTTNNTSTSTTSTTAHHGDNSSSQTVAAPAVSFPHPSADLEQSSRSNAWFMYDGNVAAACQAANEVVAEGQSRSKSEQGSKDDEADDDDRQIQRQRRASSSRLTAWQSRERKRVEFEVLEERQKELKAWNEKLQQQNIHLKQVIANFKKALSPQQGAVVPMGEGIQEGQRKNDDRLVLPFDTGVQQITFVSPYVQLHNNILSGNDAKLGGQQQQEGFQIQSGDGGTRSSSFHHRNIMAKHLAELMSSLEPNPLEEMTIMSRTVPPPPPPPPQQQQQQQPSRLLSSNYNSFLRTREGNLLSSIGSTTTTTTSTSSSNISALHLEQQQQQQQRPLFDTQQGAGARAVGHLFLNQQEAMLLGPSHFSPLPRDEGRGSSVHRTSSFVDLQSQLQLPHEQFCSSAAGGGNNHLVADCLNHTYHRLSEETVEVSPFQAGSGTLPAGARPGESSGIRSNPLESLETAAQKDAKRRKVGDSPSLTYS